MVTQETIDEVIRLLETARHGGEIRREMVTAARISDVLILLRGPRPKVKKP